MYQRLAHLYDWPGALDFSERILEKTLTCFQDAHIPSSAHILDLACGTGTLAIALAKRGWCVTGLDMSDAMLAQGRRKASLEKLPFVEGPSPQMAKPEPILYWVHADMRQFTLPHPVDVALCYSDSLNHLLTPADFEQCLQSIARSLRPGGLFLFDLNTLENYRAFWTGSDVSEGPNYRLTVTAAFDAVSGRANAEVIAEEHTEDDLPGDELHGSLTVTEEEVFEQHYPDEQVISMLSSAGFEIEARELFNLLPPGADSEESPLKSFWVCRRASS